MNISKMSLLSTTLLGLSLASVHATAGNCAGATYHSIHGYGPSPVGSYQPAVYRGPSAQPGMRAMRVGHHGGAYGKPMAAASQQDIVDIAVSAGDFNTLVTAIKAAGLLETLKGDGPYTVFAPTDEAFAEIPKDQLDALLKDKVALTKVLTYHVVAGKVTSADVVKLSSAKTVQGQSITIDSRNGVMVDNAQVIKTDIEAQNGIIHVIDTVIMPH